ncbi:hypothetical protein GCM10007216_05630 [Thalassobacillus devorans]|uniref:Uncharacterized protein n=1 Tax=Thalassobacillus devorans TaxID=279813 RepID=A0ABQ1NIF6_9BACI|nr:hypothetical protein GCM10007216_05630 [Thalassobacillus devorans]
MTPSDTSIIGKCTKLKDYAKNYFVVACPGDAAALIGTIRTFLLIFFKNKSIRRGVKVVEKN